MNSSVCSMVTCLATTMMSCISATVYYNSLQTNVRQILMPSKALGVRCGVTRRQSTGSMQWQCWSAWVSLFQKTVCSAALPTNIRKLSRKAGVYLHNCGHVLHIMCQGKSKASGASGTTCPICARQGPKRPSGTSQWW